MVKIDTIVREALADRGYNTLHLYPRYLLFAIRILRKINLDHSEDIKTVRLPVSVTKTVKYPEDYIIYNKIGMKLGDRMWNFVRDKTLTTHHVDKYTTNANFYTEAVNTVTSLRFFNFFPNFQGTRGTDQGNGFVDIFGYGHNGVGYFTTNDACREFQLSSEIDTSHIYLEYTFNNFNPDTETFVPIIVQDVIREYLHYQDAKHRPGTPLGVRRENLDDFLYELSDYDKRLSDLSYQGIINSGRIHTNLAPKG